MFTERRFLIWFVFFIAIILGFRLVEVINVNNQLDEKINQASSELEKTQKELDETINKENYYKSDEYIEKVAREQSNLVKKNDIIFITK